MFYGGIYQHYEQPAPSDGIRKIALETFGGIYYDTTLATKEECNDSTKGS